MSDFYNIYDLYRHTKGHGYSAGCECDLEGGDKDCTIQPPYETVGDYTIRLRSIIINQASTLEKYQKCLKEATDKVQELEQENKMLTKAIEADMGWG